MRLSRLIQLMRSGKQANERRHSFISENAVDYAEANCT